MGFKAARALLCLIVVQLCFHFPSWADQDGANDTILHPDMVIKVTGKEFEYLSDLALRVMLDEALYNYVNDKFKDPETQKRPKLSQTKIMYLLSHIQEHWAVVESYLKNKNNMMDTLGIPMEERPLKEMVAKLIPDLESPDFVRQARARAGHGNSFLENDQKIVFDEIAKQIKENEKLRKTLAQNIAIAQPLLVQNPAFRDGHAFDSVELAVNHRHYEDATSETILDPEDLRAKMVSLIDSMQRGDRLFFNFYDFDMPEMTDALIRAYKRGVHVLGGIDKKVYEDKPAANEQINRLKEAAKEKQADYGSLVVETVDSVGLNHQKLIAGVRHENNLARNKSLKSFAMMGSGNATQSCNGPEGDLRNWPPGSQRPPVSMPNPNHLVVFEGDHPAAIAASEIRKHVIYGLRGKNGFPIGGAYLLEGKRQKDPLDNERAVLAFSPNGGAGDINRDVYTQYLRMGKGPVWGGVFSFSSADLGKELVDLMKREFNTRRADGRSLKDLFRIVIDGGFAMRDFSVLLKLSGYNMIEYDPADPFKIPGLKNPEKDPEEFEPKEDPKSSAKKEKMFVENPDEPLFKELKDAFMAGSPLKTQRQKELEWQSWLVNWRNNIRTSPDWFKEQSFDVPGTTEKMMNQVKLHYKALAIPEIFLSNAGSSINFSNAGESNQEQIVLIQSRKITNKIVGALRYLWGKLSSSYNSIHKEAQRRNSRLTPEQKAKALEVFEFRKKWATEGQFMCTKFYLGVK